jgi:plastocyanin
VLAAVVAVTRGTARALPAAALTETAQNVLTDLRAATAYDPAELAALVGRSVSFEAREPAADGSAHSVRIVAAVTRSELTGGYLATVTARAADGTSVSVRAALVQEAPAPGAVVPAEDPPPRLPAADVPAGIPL